MRFYPIWKLLLANLMMMKPGRGGLILDKIYELISREPKKVVSREEKISYIREWFYYSSKGMTEQLFLDFYPKLKVSPEAFQKNLQKLTQRLERGDVSLLTPLDECYPSSLLELADPPVLTLKGKVGLRDFKVKVGIVGTRRASGRTLSIARELAEVLSSLGVTVVSGLARGVDGVAHRGALDVEGYTLAVLGNGVDVYYPSSNRKLQLAIQERGAVMSEYFPWQRPAKWTFPLRNRLIAAISHIIVILGAPRKSGALITARYGIELGKDVYGLFLPGDEHEGVRDLVREGSVIPFSSLDDLLSYISDRYGVFSQKGKSSLSAIEKRIVELVEGSGRKSIGELLEKLQDVDERDFWSAIDSLLEKRIIVRFPGGFLDLRQT